MRYLEVSPQPALRPFVRLIWELETRDAREFGPPLRVMPDGAVELVIQFGTPMIVFRTSESSSILPTSFLISQTSRFAEISAQGATGLIAVRFHPWGAAPFLEYRLRDFLDESPDLATVWGQEGIDLEDRVGSCGDSRQRLRIVEQFLLSRLRNHSGRIPKGVVRSFWSNPSRSIARQAHELGFSERGLERLFTRSIGPTPKRFSRIARFLVACNAIKEDSGLALTEIGASCGYYDQSHFIGEFHEFAGMTPSAFARSRNVAYLTFE